MRKTILAVTILLSGCMAHNVQMYEKIDPSNKTVMVPPGSAGLNGKLKQSLSNDGWKLIIYKGPSVTEGKVGEDTKLKSYDTFKARYRLMVSDSQYDLCLNLSPAINYDISFIDNETGAEVFTINGHGCESGAIDKFMETIRKN